MKSPVDSATSSCPHCGSLSAHPFSSGGVCLRCAGERVFSNLDFELPPPIDLPGSPPEAPAERIGPYAIIEEIGRGGMGRVYAARQAGLGRIVALKALPEGRGGVAGLELRFLREAQTAARLRHPHIVNVHDSGRADGHVYFTMDYLEGGDLARRLRERTFTARETAALVEKVARALAYTHAEGVLHRDLKPSNILLDGDEPRLADFGLASQLEPGGDLTAVTGVLGTPHYVAPEALRDGSAALTEASDLYALGVILYEMLTGRTPFAGASPAQLAQLVEREQPLPLRLIAPHVPRDLETVCLKCLERDPARRYAGAAALAKDLSRFLNGEPVLARAPGTWDYFQRMARRHRLALLAAASVMLVLTIATLVSTSLAVRARSAEKAAAAEARTSRALADFLGTDLLAQASPGEQPDRDIKVRTIVDRAAAKVDARFPHDPLIAADIHKVLADIYGSLGDYEAELKHHERTLALRQAELGPSDRATLAALGDVASALNNLGKLGPAGEQFEKLLKEQRRLLGPEHPDTLETADRLASTLLALGRVAEAEALQVPTLAASRRVVGPKDPRLLLALSTLMSIRQQQGRLPEAEALILEAVEIQRAVMGPDHPDTLTALNNLAVLYRDEGKIDDAIRINEQILASRRRRLGPEHHDTLLSMNNLAGAYKTRDRLPEAEALQSTAVDIARRTLGDEHQETMVFMGNLADTYRREGKLGQAATLLTETLSLRRRVLGPTHPHTLVNLDALGDVLLRQGQPAAAEALLRESLAARQQKDPANWMTAAARSQLGTALARQGRYAEAEPLLVEGLAGLQKVEDKIPTLRKSIVRETGDNLVALYTAWNRPDTAAEWRTRLATRH